MDGVESYVGFGECFTRVEKRGIKRMGALLHANGAVLPVCQDAVPSDPCEALVSGDRSKMPGNGDHSFKRSAQGILAQLTQLRIDAGDVVGNIGEIAVHAVEIAGIAN